MIFFLLQAFLKSNLPLLMTVHIQDIYTYEFYFYFLTRTPGPIGSLKLAAS